MKILDLRIEEFGGLKNRHIILGEGLNIIEGDNESGKSTIWLFIKFMLYGLPRKNQEDYLRSVSRSGHCAKGSMTVSFEGERYRVDRSFTEGTRGGHERIRVYRLGDGAEVFGGMQPGEAFLHVPREVFESSCGVGQMRCDGVGDKKSVDAIRNLLSAGDETADITKIESKLEKLRIAYRHKSGKGGKLYDLNERIAREKATLEKAVANDQRKHALRERLERTQAQIAKTEQAAEGVRALLTQMGKLGVLRRFDKLRENEEKSRSLEERMRELQGRHLKTEYLPTQADAATLRAQAESLSQAEARVAEAIRRRETIEPLTEEEEADAALGEKLEADGGFETVMRRIKALEKKQILAVVLIFVSLAAAIGCLAQSALLWLRIASVLPWLMVALGIALPIYYGVKVNGITGTYGSSPAEFPSLSRCAEALTRKRAYTERVSRTDAELELARTAVEPLRERLKQTITRTLSMDADASPTAEIALSEAERLEQFLREYTDCENRWNALRLMVEGEQEALAAHDENALRAELPEELLTCDDRDVKRAEQEQRLYAEQRRTLENACYQMQIELANLNAESASPLEISDRVEAWSKDYERAEEYYESLTMAIEALGAAAQAMSGSVTPRLGRDAGAMMAYVSDGKYTRLQTGNELSLSLWGEDGLPISPELMSGGTRDAAYLSLRIALMMQIFERELPPLMLDESLCALDDGRMSRLLAFLGKMSETRLQCLLFTCHKREAISCERGNIEFCKIEL